MKEEQAPKSGRNTLIRRFANTPQSQSSRRSLATNVTAQDPSSRQASGNSSSSSTYAPSQSQVEYDSRLRESYYLRKKHSLRPDYPKMVLVAIKELNDGRGSDKEMIISYIVQRYNEPLCSQEDQILPALNKLYQHGEIKVLKAINDARGHYVYRIPTFEDEKRSIFRTVDLGIDSYYLISSLSHFRFGFGQRFDR